MRRRRGPVTLIYVSESAKSLPARKPVQTLASLLIALPKIPGAICAQWVRCGKPNCRCARGARHGPYWYHFYRGADGRLVKTYVKKADVARVKAACAAWQEMEATTRRICATYNAIGWDLASAEVCRFLDAFSRLLSQTWQLMGAQATANVTQSACKGSFRGCCLSKRTKLRL